MTKFIPFSNGTEAIQWQDINCHICKRASCYAKTCIQMGFITGNITDKQAEWIGKNGNRLKSKCNNLNVPKVKKPKIKKVDDNLTLF